MSWKGCTAFSSVGFQGFHDSTPRGPGTRTVPTVPQRYAQGGCTANFAGKKRHLADFAGIGPLFPPFPHISLDFEVCRKITSKPRGNRPRKEHRLFFFGGGSLVAQRIESESSEVRKYQTRIMNNCLHANDVSESKGIETDWTSDGLTLCCGRDGC